MCHATHEEKWPCAYMLVLNILKIGSKTFQMLHLFNQIIENYSAYELPDRWADVCVCK